MVLFPIFFPFLTLKKYHLKFFLYEGLNTTSPCIILIFVSDEVVVNDEKTIRYFCKYAND
jgi:hypothetical protein